MLIIGIDPGLGGAVAMLDNHKFIGVWDTPVVKITKNKSKRMAYDPHEMRRRLFGETFEQECVVVIEHQQAMPPHLKGVKQGPRHSFTCGYGYGLWIGIIAGLSLRHEVIRPAEWKPTLLGTTKGDKSVAILAAKRMFPQAAEHLTRVKDDGRAEAILIAEYARRYVIGST